MQAAHDTKVATPLDPRIALRAFFRIAQAWKLSAEQERTLLGAPSRATLFRWKKGESAALSTDTVTRISYVLGIYKALRLLFADAAQADGWIHRPNKAPPFGGRSALERMLGGQMVDLWDVRMYLDAQRG